MVPVWLLFALLVVVGPGVVVVCRCSFRRRWTHLAECDHDDVASFFIAIVGVIYAVLLAFVVIVSWEQFRHAGDLVGQEAGALSSLYRESVAFPPEARERLQEHARYYAATVVTHEWPAMSRGEPGDPAVARALDRIAEDLAALPADTPVRQEYIAVEAERFSEVVPYRSQRLGLVDEGLPGVLWIALVFGALVTLGFAMIFGLQSTALHVTMTGSLAAVIGVLLFVAIAIDRPVAGDVAVRPVPLERVLADFSR